MHFAGKSTSSSYNPFDVGMTGLLSFASGYRAIENCGTLLLLRTDFPIASSIPRTLVSPKWIFDQRRWAIDAQSILA